MKSNLATTVVTLLMATVVSASSAWSQEAGFYLGGSLGQAEHRDRCAELGTIPCDQKDTSWRILAGYQFNRYFGIEAGYADLGRMPASAMTAALNFSAEVTAWELVAVGSVPLMDRLSLYGKLGLYRGETETRLSITVSGSPVMGTEKERNTDVTLGLGARYDITRNFFARAEWQRYGDVGGDRTGQTDIDALSVGLMYRF